MKRAYPYPIEFVIEASVQRREANTILPNEFILKDGIMIIELKYNFKRLQFIPVHFDPIKSQ